MICGSCNKLVMSGPRSGPEADYCECTKSDQNERWLKAIEDMKSGFVKIVPDDGYVGAPSTEEIGKSFDHFKGMVTSGAMTLEQAALYLERALRPIVTISMEPNPVPEGGGWATLPDVVDAWTKRHVSELEQAVLVLAHMVGPKTGLSGWDELESKHSEVYRLVCALDRRAIAEERKGDDG